MAWHLAIRPHAAWDLDDHAEYLALYASVSVANRFHTMIEKAFNEIIAAPELGSPWESPQEKLQGLRFRLVQRFKNHVVFYRITGRCIEIVRVLHGSQNLEQHLEEAAE